LNNDWKNLNSISLMKPNHSMDCRRMSNGNGFATKEGIRLGTPRRCQPPKPGGNALLHWLASLEFREPM